MQLPQFNEQAADLGGVGNIENEEPNLPRAEEGVLEA